MHFGRYARGQQSGFSLITISILLTVAAVVMVSMLPGNEAGDYNRKAISSVNKLDKVEDAVKGFMAAYGRRPCPADGQYAVSNANFGVEAATAGTCTGGTPAAPLGPDATTYVVAGVIPTKTLGLPDEYAFDEWGRRYTYVVDKRATDTTACVTLQIAGTSGGITIKNSAGATVASVMATYISHGPDGHGAWPAAGSSVANRINIGTTDTDTLDNASVNAAFATSFDNVFIQKEKTATFDDQLYIPYLKNTCCIGTSLCVLPSDGFRFNGINSDSPAMREGSYGTISADLNGDGIDDLIIANNDDATWWAWPSVHIVWGKNSGFTGPYTQTDLNGTFGTAITGISDRAIYYAFGIATGDLNGDGIDDLVIANGYSDVGYTKTYVFFGHAGAWASTVDTSTINGNNGAIFLNPFGTDHGGCSSSAVADVNGDNIKDLIIGCDMYNTNVDEGKVYAWFGHAGAWATNINLTTVNGTNGFVLVPTTLPHGGTKDLSHLGTSVAAGDLNGDGIADIVATASQNTGCTSCGGVDSWAYVLFGHSGVWAASTDIYSKMDGTNGVFLDRLESPYFYGMNTKMADFNGDGVTDLYIGTARENTVGTTVGYILWGHTGAWSSSLSFNNGGAAPAGATRLYGIPTGSGAGWGNPGDVNGDGIPDLLLGAPTYGATDVGAAYVLFGASGVWAASKDLSTLDGTTGFRINGVAANDQAGWSVGAGDINGDGIKDVLVNAAYADPSAATDAGTVYVVYGKATWSSTYNLSNVP